MKTIQVYTVAGPPSVDWKPWSKFRITLPVLIGDSFVSCLFGLVILSWVQILLVFNSSSCSFQCHGSFSFTPNRLVAGTTKMVRLNTNIFLERFYHRMGTWTSAKVTELASARWCKGIEFTWYDFLFENVSLSSQSTDLQSNISNTEDSVSSGYPNTEKRVENTTCRGVFLTKFGLFG